MYAFAIRYISTSSTFTQVFKYVQELNNVNNNAHK